MAEILAPCCFQRLDSPRSEARKALLSLANSQKQKEDVEAVGQFHNKIGCMPSDPASDSKMCT